ncbi:MAG: RNA polymerase sigma factor [Desulfobacterales bacterium]|nr:RNA polymerase sigma factor [Desulfobacterales bacterium]
MITGVAVINKTNSSRNINAELVDQARSGDRIAIGHLVDRYQKDIYRMVYYRTNSIMDAEDLTQDIFIQMVKGLSSLKEATRFKAWLFRIAVNRVHDFHRKKKILSFFGSNTKAEEIGPEIQSSGNPAEKIMAKEFISKLSDFSENLSRWEREIFMLRFIDQLGISEITSALNKNESTVKTHLYRAIAKFRNNADFRSMLAGE